MFIELDFNSNEAIYMQLRNQIILGIAQDKIKNGESLPSVRQLAEDIGVNMHTVNKAYALLRNDGYLKLDRRKGAVVCVTVESRKEQLEKVNLDMQMLVAEAICKDISLADGIYRAGTGGACCDGGDCPSDEVQLYRYRASALWYAKLSVGDCVEDSRGEWGRRILCFKISGTKQWNEEDKGTCVFR